MTHNNPQSFFLRLCMVAVAVMMAVGVWGQEVKLKLNQQSNQLTGEELVIRGLDYYHKQNKPDSALVCFALAANRRFNKSILADSTETAACAEALNLMGTIYEKAFFDYQKAYYYYLKSEQFAKEHDYKKVLPNIHNNMAGILSYKESAKKRDLYNSDILNLYKNAFHEAWEAKVYNVLGVIVVNMSIRALDWNMTDSIKDELQLYGKGGFKALFFEHHSNICNAVLACAEGKHDKGLMLLDKALGSDFGFSNLDKGPDSALIYHVKSNILFRLGKNEEALKQTNKVIELSKRWNDHIDLCEVYDRLSTFYKERNENQTANYYELLYLREKDFIVNKSKLADMQQTKLLLEIDELNKEAEAMAMRDRMKSWMLWMVSGFALLIVCLLIFLYLKYKQVKENHRLLYLKSLDMIRTDEEKRQLIEKQEAQIRQYEELEKKEAAHEVHKLDEEKMTNLLHRIFMVMETSDEVYSNDFSMNRLAELVGDTRNNVSEAINRQYKTGFHDLVNEYRVKEACRRMNDIEHYGHLTIEYISSELGFKSRTTFIAAFKKNIGLTPSAYLKLAKER